MRRARTSAGRGRAPVAAAAAALVLAAGASFTFASTPAASPRGATAARLFLQAWERKLRGTYVVDATLTRSPASGGRLQVGTRLVQRPPDRLVIGLGSVDGRLHGKLVRCGPVVQQSCSPEVDAPSYADDVSDEMHTLQAYVDGEEALYRVVAFVDTRCFRLQLAKRLPAPPYGDEALFCFDKATGAPTTTVIRRGQSLERTDAASVRPNVTEADLRLPDDRGQVVLLEPPTTTTTTSTVTTTSTTPR